MPSKRSQTQKAAYCMIPSYDKGQTTEKEIMPVIARNSRWVRESATKGHFRTFWHERNIPYLDFQAVMQL